MVKHLVDFDDTCSPFLGVKDVSKSAHEYVFYTLNLHQDVTLGDLFTLIDNDPFLRRSLRQFVCGDILDRARLAGEQKPQGYSPTGLEFIELYWEVKQAGSAGLWTVQDRLCARGVGFELKESCQHPNWFQEKGTRCVKQLRMLDLNELVALPLRFSKHFKPSDLLVFAKTTEDFITPESISQPYPQATLSQVLNGVLWELTYYGTY